MAVFRSLTLCLFAVLLTLVSGDTPANCTYADVEGTWVFSVGQGGNDNTLKCKTMGPISTKTTVRLEYPDKAVDVYGNQGFWTIIYNQGFEVVIHGRKYFAFSKYKHVGENITSFCDQTMPGWTHDTLGHDWACFVGQKRQALLPKTYQYRAKLRQQPYKENPTFIKQINTVQNSWTAGRYEEYEKMTIEDLIRRAGGRKSQIISKRPAATVTDEVRRLADDLPEEFDWRDVDGVNFVSPVRNQASCGSCYSFASMAMNEARLRIKTNNSVQLVFSPQDIVGCSEYSQGCEGGFPYLIGGKYAEDFGLVEESCTPYQGHDLPCATKPSCQRHYSTSYRYVGGYYGACNEAVMQAALVKNGPLAIGFEVHSDFLKYKSGIYHHTGLDDKFNPFERTNHAVLVVGYGADKDTGEKFWTVKNSWGESWGEKGYFRILRGSDECAVESMAVESFPIF